MHIIKSCNLQCTLQRRSQPLTVNLVCETSTMWRFNTNKTRTRAVSLLQMLTKCVHAWVSRSCAFVSKTLNSLKQRRRCMKMSYFELNSHKEHRNLSWSREMRWTQRTIIKPGRRFSCVVLKCSFFMMTLSDNVWTILNLFLKILKSFVHWLYVY